jgi:hypothetical protein
MNAGAAEKLLSENAFGNIFLKNLKKPSSAHNLLTLNAGCLIDGTVN